MLCALLLLLSGRWSVHRATTHKNVQGFSSAWGKRTTTNLAGGGMRTAGSDKNNQPQQYCAYGCAAHARRVGGSVGTMGYVHVYAFCLLCTWYMSELCSQLMSAYNSRREENRPHVTDQYVQNKASRIESREIVLSTPAGKKL